MPPWSRGPRAPGDDESDEEERFRPAVFETERQRAPQKDGDSEEWWTWIASHPHPLCNIISIALLLLVVLTAFIAVTAPPPPPLEVPDSGLWHDTVQRMVTSDIGVVAADESRCSAIGRDVLAEGGTAVDAAVATALCLGVVRPEASGVGGGAFMLIRNANGSAEVIDMREEAPSRASQDMYKGDPQKAVDGGLAVAVPGELAGLYLAWQRHGRLKWARLVEPAIKLAEGGFEVEGFLAASIAEYGSTILSNPGMAQLFAPDGVLLQKGDVAYRKTLAQTLRRVADETPSVLHTGGLAAKLAADVRAAGGIMTAADLASYRPRIREPLRTMEMGYEVLGAPPPSSGGATVIQILKTLSAFDMPLAALGALGTHWIAEAFKHAFAMRMSLGDPEFVDVTAVLADMLSSDFAAQVRANISDDRTFPPEYYGGKWSQLDDHGTSHVSIVDSERNAVALTTTINTGFGSKVVSPSTGIILNNEMDDFSIPDTRNSFGLAPSEANFIRPGKRPLSSMSPTIVVHNGVVRMVAGASGGPRIITGTAQVLLNFLAGGKDPLAAVVAPRIHHQLIPDEIAYETLDLINGQLIELPPDVRNALLRRGHKLVPTTFGSVCQVVVHDLEVPVTKFGVVKPMLGRWLGPLTAVSDPRKDGAPAGV
ncbi:gamma-glutamyltranspeptidase [Klebsormidium nitens]|uniref:Glutathione hydrolase n=1 Tax=Klebsormidium nitens TaxID=105231 RepID=A0A1Y1ILJ3_KLENI|nr:gamma-glutamyltranspeptidase [Klebsormidium nitens]|eukprot:GAQ91012.1 gamma-glutamyltranspeptidase [Klebsormidium nitens]